MYTYFINESDERCRNNKQINNEKEFKNTILKPDVKFPIEKDRHHQIKEGDKNERNNSILSVQHHHRWNGTKCFEDDNIYRGQKKGNKEN